MNEQNNLKRRGLMLVLSSPSGAGKTTLSRMLLEGDDDVVMSVSATTREARPGEEQGKDYYFVSHERFKEMVDCGELLEHAIVFGNHYGTPRGPVMETLNNGRDVLFDIDWQGTQQLHESVREDLVRVFILPPSIKALEDRLRRRAQDSDAVVQDRMSKAEGEISHWAEYDYVLVNQDLDKTFSALKAILAAERHKRSRNPELSGFVRGLLSERSKV